VFANRGTNFAAIGSETINQLSRTETVTYSFIENRSLGFFIQETASFKDRFFLTGALRFDDNSTFGTAAPPVRYPRLSASWVVSDESFWSLDQVSTFRVRAAWGKAGRQPSALSRITTFMPTPGPSGEAAILPSTVANDAIEPEVSTELELGFEYAVLNDRISGEFTHYNRSAENQLLDLALSPSRGIPGAVQKNAGRLDNWGWEATMNSHVYDRGGFSFDLDLGADHADNEIKELGDYPGDNNIRIGLPYPNNTVAIRVTEAKFVNSNEPSNYRTSFGERIMAYCDQGVSLAPAGSSAVTKLQYGLMPGGESGSCSTANYTYVGRGFATYTFRVSPRFSFFDNRLSVFALAEGQYGRTNQASDKMYGHVYLASPDARIEINPVFMAEVLGSPTSTTSTMGRTFYDADFWKLREIGARVSIPNSVARRFKASNASIALSGRNLLTLWQAQEYINGLKITDPEYGNPSNAGGGGSFYQTPPLSSVTATLRVSF
jgi:hypothetical protein